MMPARLAVGLEAKKSSSVDQIRPRLGYARLWFPRVISQGNGFGNLFVAILANEAAKRQHLYLSERFSVK